jgi:hypothetical protein
MEGTDGIAQQLNSLRDDDQVTILMNIRLQIDTLQQRVQISENIISVLNREVEKTQLRVEALERENQSSQNMIHQLEIKVQYIVSHRTQSSLVDQLYDLMLFHSRACCEL